MASRPATTIEGADTENVSQIVGGSITKALQSSSSGVGCFKPVAQVPFFKEIRLPLLAGLQG